MDPAPLTVARVALSAFLLVAAGGCGTFDSAVFSAVRVEDVVVELAADDSQPARIVFDIGWDNSFRDQLNRDAVWVFVKLRAPGEPWRHARIAAVATAHEIGIDNGVPATIEPSADGMGAFLYRADDGFTSIDWQQVSLALEPNAALGSGQADVEAEVIALEMVYVPAGSFLLGDGTSVPTLLASQFESGGSGRPYAIESEASLVLGGGGQGSLGNHDRRMPAETPQQYWDDFSGADRRTLPAAFPKGFAPFWVMKHELTQGDYARFLDTLEASQQATRNPAASIGVDEEHRYAISAAAPFRVVPYNRAANWLSWMDLAAFADWSGLRPMTELEFEKAARGDRTPDAGEFAWGPETPPGGKYSLQDAGTPQELVVNQADGANVAFAGTVGLSSSISGPLRSAAFLPLATSRLAFGGSHYRLTEMSGNVAEMVVSVGRSAGRRFSGRHGDGELSAAGNAAGAGVESWPGARRAARGGYEVLIADGSGTRGGDWTSSARSLRVSDREHINKPADRRDMRWGGRLVRSAPAVVNR